MKKILEQIEKNNQEYKLKHYGRTDVDMHGRPLLTQSQIDFIHKTEKMNPMSIEEAIAPLYEMKGLRNEI